LGGGKTWSILVDNLFGVHDPDYFSVFFRKTNNELETNLWPEAKKMYEPLLKNSKGKFKLFTNKKLLKLENDIVNLWIKPCEDYDFFQYIMDKVELDKPIPIRDYDAYFDWKSIEYNCDKIPKWIKSYFLLKFQSSNICKISNCCKRKICYIYPTFSY